MPNFHMLDPKSIIQNLRVKHSSSIYREWREVSALKGDKKNPHAEWGATESLPTGIKKHRGVSEFPALIIQFRCLSQGFRGLSLSTWDLALQTFF